MLLFSWCLSFTFKLDKFVVIVVMVVVDELLLAAAAELAVVVKVVPPPFAVLPPPLFVACPFAAIECLSFDVGVLLGVLFCF